ERMALLERSLQRASWLIYLLGGSVCVLMAVGTWRLVSSIARREALSRALLVQQDQYHRLAILLQKGHEEERASMARRVHDEVGQTLTAAKMDIGMGIRKLDNPDIARPTLQRAIGTLEQTLRTTRAIATELRPPILDQLGLATAVDWQLHEFQSRFAGTAKWEAELDEQHLSSEAKLALFRVLQEALTNIVRHAKAKNVEIRLERTGDEVAMSVIDDGVGMNPTHAAHKSLGLLGMRERVRAIGGELEIQSEVGKGATVTARVPATVET
ncbi:MAG: sensor histidine kinase, partial [Bryobacterales bacterium]|nr:sensor histidine kinase [Bryobacterales bacterium]